MPPEQTQDSRESAVHTCHAECPCQTGGVPTPDFIEVGCLSCNWTGFDLTLMAFGGVRAPCPFCRSTETKP